MNLEFYGHNCFAIAAGGVKILTDPWFSPAWYTWYPYPINRRLRSVLLSNQQDFDYLYVSHAHPDHFDTTFLTDLRKDIKIICPDFASKSMQKKYAALGFHNLIESDSGQLTETLHFRVLQDKSPLKEDSALYLEEGQGQEGISSFLNLNDCFIDYARLPRDVTYLATQFSTAIYYPHAYDFPEDVKAKKIFEMQETNWKHCLEGIKQVKPSFYIPSSGPPRFLDPDLANLNNSRTSVYYDFDYVRDDFRSSTNIDVLELNPGDSYASGKIRRGSKPEDWDIESWSKRLENEWNAFNFDRTDYSEADLKEYFVGIKENNAEFVKRFPRRFGLRIDSPESLKEYVVALDASENVICRASEAGSFNYTFTLPAQLIRRVLYHDWNWLDTLATMKTIVHRDEDYYDQALFQLLTFGRQPETLRILLQRLENNVEMIKKGQYVIQRLCPHAGHDLSYATIEGNVLTCPRHRWQWDLTTGRCLRGGNTPIMARPADPS